MKIRNGFVSNSSSTSFTFCYKGKGIKPLTNLILTKYSSNFERCYDEWSCNASDVVKAIENCFEHGNKWDKIKPVHIDKIIEQEEFSLKRVIEDMEQEKDEYWKQRSIEREQTLEAKIRKLQSIKEKGLTTVLIVGFGDSHGEVSGGSIGYAMDYDGRCIDINGKDLVVFTEQNR